MQRKQKMWSQGSLTGCTGSCRHIEHSVSEPMKCPIRQGAFEGNAAWVLGNGSLINKFVGHDPCVQVGALQC